MGSPCLSSRSEKERIEGVEEMIEGGEKKIKGLRNYAALYITVHLYSATFVLTCCTFCYRINSIITTTLT